MMTYSRTWACLSALALTGCWLTVGGVHKHSDGHHHHVHHTHVHHHDGTTHSHEHRHTTGNGDLNDHESDDHHHYSDNDHSPVVVLILPPRVTRPSTQLQIDCRSLDVTCLNCSDGSAVALTPPRSPPAHYVSQDSLPQLRTIVLLT